jgi:hypothetical protein
MALTYIFIFFRRVPRQVSSRPPTMVGSLNTASDVLMTPALSMAAFSQRFFRLRLSSPRGSATSPAPSAATICRRLNWYAAGDPRCCGVVTGPPNHGQPRCMGDEQLVSPANSFWGRSGGYLFSSNAVCRDLHLPLLVSWIAPPLAVATDANQQRSEAHHHHRSHGSSSAVVAAVRSTAASQSLESQSGLLLRPSCRSSRNHASNTPPCLVVWLPLTARRSPPPPPPASHAARLLLQRAGASSQYRGSGCPGGGAATPCEVATLSRP